MSMSRCGNICIMPPKCSCKKRRHGFSKRSSVDAVMSGRSYVSMRKQKHFIWPFRKYSLSDIVLQRLVYCKYKHHHRVCHATLFPSRAWTDKTNFKAEARDYGKGNYISDACLWCSVNHNALCQLANQSILSLLEGGALWKTTCFREAGHRGPTIMYSSASQTCPQDPPTLHLLYVSFI